MSGSLRPPRTEPYRCWSNDCQFTSWSWTEMRTHLLERHPFQFEADGEVRVRRVPAGRRLL
jgi:hypothetical protein